MIPPLSSPPRRSTALRALLLTLVAVAAARAAVAQPTADAADADAAVLNAFGTRLLNVATPETVGRRNFEILATFRLSETVQAGSAHDLWGIDSGADVGLGLAAGLGSRLQVEFYRSSAQETFEAAAKFALLRQASGAPLSVTFRAGEDYLAARGVSGRSRPFAQAIAGYRCACGLSLFLAPSWVRETPRLRNAFNVPVGLGWELPHRWGLAAEWVPKNHDLSSSRAAWSAALIKGTPHDIFKLTFSNSRATTVDEILGGDFSGGFKQGDVRLGLNFTHTFGL
jgi:hypothetical protein